MLGDAEQIGALCDSLQFGADGLIPAVVQDAGTGEVLMVAYMNRESLELSLRSGQAWYYSRSRHSLWLKGETSGHYQYIREVSTDCDRDALLVRVEQVGVACHEGYRSCFFRRLAPAPAIAPPAAPATAPEESRPPGGASAAALSPEPDIFDALADLIVERRRTLPEKSYTAELFRKGIDRIAQKVGEEAVEVVIAGKNRSREAVIEEASDLIYHLLVLLAECDVSLNDIRTKLAERRQ